MESPQNGIYTEMEYLHENGIYTEMESRTKRNSCRNDQQQEKIRTKKESKESTKLNF